MAMLYIATQRQHKSNVRRLSSVGPKARTAPSASDLARNLGLSRATTYRMIRLFRTSYTVKLKSTRSRESSGVAGTTTLSSGKFSFAFPSCA